MSEAPEPVHDLEGLLRALRNAVGALSSQGGQIEQMKGMFNDEDDAIAGALEDGEDAENELGSAIAYVQTLMASTAAAPEVLVSVSGGVVQDVFVVEGQSEVRVFVEDGDLDDEDVADGAEIALLQEEGPNGRDFHAAVHVVSTTALPPSGRRWTSVRSEVERMATGGVRRDLAADAGEPPAG